MGERLRDVELFASGTYRGREYTPDDVDEMVINGRKFSAILHPPAVCGHEEEDEDGNPTPAPEPGRTDIPADGWVDPASLKTKWKYTPIRDDGGRMKVMKQRVLVGDLTDVPPETADLIRQRRLRKLSAEVYDDFTDDSGQSHGKALRRVAFLGGEPPQVKGLADLPMPSKFAERLRPIGGRATDRGTFVAFAEVVPVGGNKRDEDYTAIKTAMPGLQATTLTDLKDDQLADLAKNLPADSPTPATQLPTPAPETPMIDRAALIAALVAAGQDQAQLDAMTDEQLQARAAELGVTVTPPEQPAAPMAEGEEGGETGTEMMPSVEELTAMLIDLGADPASLEGKTPEELMAMLDELTAGQPATPPAQPAAPMSDMAKVKKYSERVIAQAAELQRRLAIERRHLKTQRINTFSETLVRSGRFTPAQMEFVKGLLMLVPDVAKFSDGKPGVTMLDRQLAKASKLPSIRKFGEKVTNPAPNPKDLKAKAVQAYQAFSEASVAAIKATGKTVQQNVEEFSKIFDRDPQAAMSLIPDHYKPAV